MMRRYFHFPHFHYDVWAAMNYGRADAYVVTPAGHGAGHRAVPRCCAWWTTSAPTSFCRSWAAPSDNILQESGGRVHRLPITPASPKKSGVLPVFVEREPGDGVVIPNYLTPPLLENTEYYYFTKRTGALCHLPGRMVTRTGPIFRRTPERYHP